MSPTERSTDVFAVPAGRPAAGRLRVPPSKSITQRYFNLALIARRPLIVHRPLVSEDPTLFLEALAATGFEVRPGDDRVELIPGNPPAEAEIFCGNGGTMYRFLTAALTTLPGTWHLDGVPRLRERPVGPLILALRELGAEIHCPDREGFAPLRIRGASLRGGAAHLDAGASSQYLSALLMAALAAREPVAIEVGALRSEPYVDLTLDAMAEFRGTWARDGDTFRVEPWRSDDETAVRDVVVEGDYSGAAYPAAAATLCGTTVELDGLRPDSRQGDRGFIDLLGRMGARIRWQDRGLQLTGPAVGSLRGVEADMSATPDQVPTLAALAPFAHGTTRIMNVPHLRIKECDRLHAMAQELGRLGVRVEELPDGLIIPGIWAAQEPPDSPVEVLTYGDHRIAMSLGVLSLAAEGATVIHDAECTTKSYPGFWDHLAGLGADVRRSEDE